MKLSRVSLLLAFGVLGLTSTSALADVHCVSKTGSPGCATTIAAGIAAASPGDTVLVGPGVYHEMVTITFPVALQSTGDDPAVIDAAGLLRGFFVNGLSTPGLMGVHINGFVVENAGLEGILVLNASDVTVSNNIVRNNDRNLSNGVCAQVPSFEPGEADDCGEGIHLQGADHSVVTGNSVHGNSGGILVSDDTRASFNNVIANNVVEDNLFDCGITLAAHTPVTASTTIPFGIFHNTVFGNRAIHNGTSGQGAGIGLFASAPGTATYGNTVVDNYSARNGLPGVAMHAHTPNQTFNDNLIVGNTLVDNAADTDDAATPGTTGINLYTVSPAPGTMILLNTIRSERYDVVVNDPSSVLVEFNSLLGAGRVGLSNQGTGFVDATDNFWGCAAGPGFSNCSNVLGNNILYIPVLPDPARGEQDGHAGDQDQHGQSSNHGDD